MEVFFTGFLYLLLLNLFNYFGATVFAAALVRIVLASIFRSAPRALLDLISTVPAIGVLFWLTAWNYAAWPFTLIIIIMAFPLTVLALHFVLFRKANTSP